MKNRLRRDVCINEKKKKKLGGFGIIKIKEGEYFIKNEVVV